jgi:hypothetical protein
MKRTVCLLIWILLLKVGNSQESHFELKKELKKELKEISGLVRDGDFLWAIADNKGDVYKLDLSGNVVQQVHLTNVTVSDVEAVAVDANYLYVGDVGDNEGVRAQRTVIRIAKDALGKGRKVNVSGEQIHFTFPDEGNVKKKKTNNYDCEAMFCYKDVLYVFTKRRDDGRTELYTLSSLPGTTKAKNVATFKTKGLITDACINAAGTEVALVGYDEGHTKPFIWILSNFQKNDFFSGVQQRFELTNEKRLDWQVESIAYGDHDSFYIACERTKDVPNTLYRIQRKELLHSTKSD